MKIQVSGKHVDVGDALREKIKTQLSLGIAKYFERGGDAEVTISKQGYLFKADCWIRLASGQTLISHGTGNDAHSAFDATLDHIEKRIRRYKQRLKNHHTPIRQESTPLTVLKAYDEEDDDIDDGMDHTSPPQAMIIAETHATLQTMTVSAAVNELEMSNYPVIMFRNAGHGGLSVVYRRPDGHIGWIDPERTTITKQNSSVKVA